MSSTPLLGLRRVLSRGRTVAFGQAKPSICLFCSLSKHHAPGKPLRPVRARRKSFVSPRYQSTESSAETTTSDPRKDLEASLLDLQTHAANYVNFSRLQLALRNLKEQPGQESIRVAFLGITNGSPDPGNTAKNLLRLVLADPLQSPSGWESRLQGHDASRPLIVRVGATSQSPEEAARSEKLETARDNMIPEINVSSPALNGADFEMLLIEADTLALAETSEPNTLEDSVLVPTVDLSTPSSTHPIPITTPVHMALLVGDGVLGAASILSLPILEGQETIATAVNFKSLDREDMLSCPFTKINVNAGNEGLNLFRANVSNAMKYESLWSEANISRITEWLRTNVSPNDSAVTKPPVRNLIHSLLQNTTATIQAEEARSLSQSLAANISPHSITHLNEALSDWSQTAHQELEHQLEVAFTSRPWRKLNWWKLFWRVDDVGMLSSDMLALRFLPDAEKGIIYLAGRVQEAQSAEPLLYSGPALPSSVTDVVTSSKKRSAVVPGVSGTMGMWPGYIPYTRNYLQEKTVPALQALAQKLVLQSITTTALTSALGVLSYVSALGAYESGGIAALGLVWSLRRLQRKWEAAREFWEGEVREEGRKAVRATEGSVAEVLERATGVKRGSHVERLAELGRVRGIVERAEGALGRMR